MVNPLNFALIVIRTHLACDCGEYNESSGKFEVSSWKDLGLQGPYLAHLIVRQTNVSTVMVLWLPDALADGCLWRV
jgi:hypothetical protein